MVAQSLVISAQESQNPVVVHVPCLYTLAEENAAYGNALFSPLKKNTNAYIHIRGGIITEINHKKGADHLLEIDAQCMAPPLVNAHTHLQLSWLEERLDWQNGFSRWLQSMLPLLKEGFDAEAANKACRQITSAGAFHVGDVGGSLAESLACLCRYANEYHIDMSHFCEWLGFMEPMADNRDIWPPRCRREVYELDSANLIPACHALYSTAPYLLQKVHKWCKKNNKVFSFHLAESEDETQMLCEGGGPLYELYASCLLPQNWQSPEMRPCAFANKLNILDENTLAVHCVQLAACELAILSEKGVAVCLCPRSNNYLGVGEASYDQMLTNKLLLCLGTDGLTSNIDLNIQNEAKFILDRFGPNALLRMLTVNGAKALHLSEEAARIKPGSEAIFSILCPELIPS